MDSNEIALDNDAFLVSQTDLKGNIIYANDDFCQVAGYSKSEIIGKPHNIIRDMDMPKAAFKIVWDTIQSGKTWAGLVKNRAKNGKFYWVHATISSITTIDGQKGYISCRVKPSLQEIKEADTLYKEIRSSE